MSLVRTEATRYVTPLREGGSLPAVMEAADANRYVVKFRGAGQGPKALVAEIIVAELARQMELPVPSLALVELDEAMGRNERHDEIRDLLMASVGVNVGLAFLESSLMFDAAAAQDVDALVASRIVALDSFVMNVDRTPRNPNLLWHASQLWLIDHGAALYFHHDWDGSPERADRAFPMAGHHVLLPQASQLEAAGAHLSSCLSDDALRRVVELVPDELLPEEPIRWRNAYVDFLAARRGAIDMIIEEAQRARSV